MSDSGFALRAASVDDVGFLVDMLVEAVNWDPGRAAVGREQVMTDPATRHYLAGWPRPGDIGVVAVDAGARPIGAAWLRQFSAAEPGYGFVGPDVPELSVGVVPPWRGRGVGGALIRAVARQAAAAGVVRVSLSVERANPARGLYEREGFALVARGPGADTMVKSLEPG